MMKEKIHLNLYVIILKILLYLTLNKEYMINFVLFDIKKKIFQYVFNTF